jgi:hypothetical protein
MYMRRLARLRWLHAFHVLGTREKKMLVISGDLGDQGNLSSLTRKVGSTQLTFIFLQT